MLATLLSPLARHRLLPQAERMGRGDPPATDLAPRPSVTLPAQLRLVVVKGPDAAEITLGARTYHVGKAPDCDLVLTDGQVSRHHLEVQLSDGGVVLRDLGSRNGASCRGARFNEIVVAAGAVVQIGETELAIRSVEASSLPPSQADRFGGLRGRSLAMREVFALLERVAPTDLAVLIEGETGTGKELCATALHAASARRRRPFVVCDLGGLSRSLLESELFGHVRGAFTGAERNCAGLGARARRHALPRRGGRARAGAAAAPVARARAAQGQAGGRRRLSRGRRARRRRDQSRPRRRVREGRFRDDLFHRLSAVRVTLPPLRERREDVPLLIEHFLSGRGVKIASETVALLCEYDWPGNVRELKNRLDRAISLGNGAPIEPGLLGFDVAAAKSEEGFRAAKDRLINAWEADYVAKLLARSGGNVSEAARRAGVDRAYLHRLIKKHDLD